MSFPAKMADLGVLHWQHAVLHAPGALWVVSARKVAGRHPARK